MKCFFYFKDKSRSRKQRSAPELEEQSKSEYSEADRVTKSSHSESSRRGIPQLYEEKAHSLRVFSYKELRYATNDFSRLLKIGEGGFGSVYKGSIKPAEGEGDPVVVAIKKLNKDGLQVRVSAHLLENIIRNMLLMCLRTVDFMLIMYILLGVLWLFFPIMLCALSKPWLT